MDNILKMEMRASRVTIATKLSVFLSKITGNVVLFPLARFIGDCSEEIQLGLMKARRERKKLVLIFQYPFPNLLNKRLRDAKTVHPLVVDIWYDLNCEFLWGWKNRNLFVLRNLLFTFVVWMTLPYQILVKTLNQTFLNFHHFFPETGKDFLMEPKTGSDIFDLQAIETMDWSSQFNIPFNIEFKIAAKFRAEQSFADLGLPENAWFVCLHVREKGFHDDAISRNASILGYTDLILAVTTRGGWVVRMGDDSMTRLPLMKNVIDYPFTPQKSQLLDFFLICRCKFYIGMQSGIMDLAGLFCRPMIVTNIDYLPHTKFKSGDLYIPRRVFSKKEGRILSIREMIEYQYSLPEYETPGGWVRWPEDDFDLIQNSPSELADLVEEYFKKSSQSGISELQIASQMYFKELGRRALIEGNDNSTKWRIRLATYLEANQGVISVSFLQKYW